MYAVTKISLVTVTIDILIMEKPIVAHKNNIWIR